MSDNYINDSTDELLGINLQGEEQYITFSVSNELYAVDILAVQEMLSWQGCREVPAARDYIRGIIEVRGLVVPVVDVRKRILSTLTECDASTVVILVKTQTQKVLGLIVEAVCDVCHVSVEAQSDAKGLEGAVELEFVKSVVNVNNNMIMIIDLEKLVDMQVLAQYQDKPFPES